MTNLILALVLASAPTERVVKIEAPNHIGTAVNIGRRKLLTAHHVAGDPSLYLCAPTRKPCGEDTKVEPIKFKKDDDLVLLRAPHLPNMPPVELREAEVGEHVTFVGYPYGIRLQFEGTVAGYHEKYMFIDMPCGKGSSGSPIWGDDGKMVGMVMGAVTDHNVAVCIAIPAKTIMEFLE